MAKAKIRSATSSWWAARHKILAVIKKGKSVKVKAKNVRMNTVKRKKMVKGKKATKSKRAAKVKKIKR